VYGCIHGGVEGGRGVYEKKTGVLNDTKEIADARGLRRSVKVWSAVRTAAGSVGA